MDNIIRMLHSNDYSEWVTLYHGYADHYQVTLTPEGITTTWNWLMDTNHPTTGLVVEASGHLIGLAHYRAMPSPLRGMDVGFLDDLFVVQSARGAQVGSQLLNTLKDIGAKNNWPVIRWITRDNNYRARTLYDRLATKSDWNTYEMLTDIES